jgi:hypothetical protein
VTRLAGQAERMQNEKCIQKCIKTLREDVGIAGRIILK